MLLETSSTDSSHGSNGLWRGRTRLLEPMCPISAGINAWPIFQENRWIAMRYGYLKAFKSLLQTECKLWNHSDANCPIWHQCLCRSHVQPLSPCLLCLAVDSEPDPLTYCCRFTVRRWRSPASQITYHILKKQTLKPKVIIGYLSLILTLFKKVKQTARSDTVYWC